MDSKPNLQELNAAAADFAVAVDDLYGHYLDSTIGFQRICQAIIDAQTQTKPSLPAGTDLDSLDMFIGCGDPADPSHFLQHRTTQGQFKRRNAPGGYNRVRAAQFLIVLVYTFWDTRYRASIAAALGLKDPGTLKVPLLGDLRRLRNDIVHCKGIIQKETAAKLEVLTQFNDGEEIILDENAVFALVQSIKAALDTLIVEAGGADPHHRTVWQIYGSTVRPKPTSV